MNPSNQVEISLIKKLTLYAKLARLNRPIGSYLLLWPTLMALWIAGDGHPPYFITFIFVLGVFVMRSAGCVINDYADRKFDAYVARTRERPLVTFQVSAFEAKILFLFFIAIAFLLVIQLNTLTILLSFVALFLAGLYPFMKRYTHFPQIVLGAAYAFSIPMAFAAIRMEVPAIAWLLFGATLFWVLAFDTEYALMDREDDVHIGVKSTAIFFKERTKLFIAAAQVLALLLWMLLGVILQFRDCYFLGLTMVTALFIYQYYLIKTHKVQSYFQAFLNNNLLGLVLFLGLFLNYYL